MLDRVRAWLSGPPQAPNDGQLETLATRLQTIARAQSTLSLRLDELSTRLDDNHRELLDRLDATRGDDDLLDAIDRLDDARASLSEEQEAIAGGLSAIAARLERVVAARGLVRHAEVGQAVDGRRFRVIGTERREGLPDGVISRVVRSAATRGDELVREGEVIVNKV